MAKIPNLSKKRIIVTFFLLTLVFILMAVRFAWIQIVKADEYRDKAIEQQTRDIPVDAKRGDILDRGGKQLATSVICYDVWMRPATLKNEYSKEQLQQFSDKIAVILDEDSKGIMKILNSGEQLIPLAKGVEKESADKIRNLNLEGTEINERPKRYYPLNDFASSVIGSINEEGVGNSGIEQEYNAFLSGVSGRSVRDDDKLGNELAYGEKKFLDAKDGGSVKLTIDEVLQHYMEDSITQGMEKFKALKAWGIAMNPKTGEILAMTKRPSFNPNVPGKPTDTKELTKFKKMNGVKQGDYINKLWRNPMISDTYEPGSTFKLLVSSAMLEEGLATPETTFYCGDVYDVDGIGFHCAENKSHGTLTLREAVGVSCNKAHIQMGQKLGRDKFYQYMGLFGIDSPTGVDMPAEAQPQIKNKDKMTNVDFATMAFGQGVAISPIQLIAAIGAIGNDGVMMQPHIVKEYLNSDGKVIKKIKPQIKKKVLSKTTSEEMKKIMEEETTIYGGRMAKIDGYRIGGKTGTANIASEGDYESNLYCSFISLSPINDPELAVLIIYECSAGNFGATTATLTTKDFLIKALPYLHIERQKTEGEEDHLNKDVEFKYVPKITGMTYKEAKKVLDEAGLKSEIRPKLSENEDIEEIDFTVSDQYPKAGKKINVKSSVFIYRD